RPAKLDDFQAAPLYAILPRHPLQVNDPMHDAVNGSVGPEADATRPIVQKQRRTLTAGEKLFQSKDLPPVPGRIARQQPNLGKRVEDNPRRSDLIHLLEYVSQRRSEFNIARVENRVLVLWHQALWRWHHLEQIEAV